MKIRVLAQPPPSRDDQDAVLVYRAEAYDGADPFREPQWTCDHQHDSPQAAHDCGVEWLGLQADPAAPL